MKNTFLIVLVFSILSSYGQRTLIAHEKSAPISLDGDLDYLGNKTFDFEGDYFVFKETNNLDFNLSFDKMQIDFANAFLDPDVVDDLSGLINGNIKLKGELTAPKIDGDLLVKDTKATIALLGVDLHLNGKINVIEDAFFIDNMPVVDEDGNVGRFYFKLIGAQHLHDKCIQLLKKNKYFLVNNEI